MRETAHISHIVQELDRHTLLPAIVFRSSRSQCDVDAERAGTNVRLRLSPNRQRIVRQEVHKIISVYEMDPELILSHPQYNSLVLTGIGAHHAGQLLMWRLLLEEMMSAGVLRVMVATGTVAAGVDFPARTVVITAHSKRGAAGFKELTSAEFQQMSGRAGRRGRDTVGFCVAAPSMFNDARALLEIARQPPEPLVSAYFPSPSTVLNLLRYRSVDGLRYTVERSLAAFIDRKNARSLREQAHVAAERLPPPIASKIFVDSETAINLAELTSNEGARLNKEEKKLLKRVRRFWREAVELEARQVRLLDSVLIGLETLGYLEGTSLSPKGYWAANLWTNLAIELGELLEAGVFDGAPLETAVAIVASISGDEHREYLRAKEPPLDKEMIGRIGDVITRVRALQIPGAGDVRAVLPDAAYTVLAWLRSGDWHEYRSYLMLTGVAEGDAARLITQTAEHLSQLARLTQTHFEIAMCAEEAKRRLLRPPLTEVINLDTT